MERRLEEILFKKYPEIFAGKDKPITESLIPFGIECGDGWYSIIDRLCELIQRYTRNHPDISVEAVQVKEKFGRLCFYINGGDDYIDGLIDLAEALSYKVCEKCGSMQTVQTQRIGGWIYTRCELCRQKSEGNNG